MAEGWHVTGSAPTTETDPAGRIHPVVRVDFVTDKGSRSYITVPFAEFTADHVRPLVAAAAAHLIAVENL